MYAFLNFFLVDGKIETTQKLEYEVSDYYLQSSIFKHNDIMGKI